MIKISPSLLSCDFSRMGEECKKMENDGADWLHIDVMDGHFVPNLTLGAPIVKAIRPVSALPFDVHLMITFPHQYIEDFVRAGADIITFHVEAESDIQETIDLIKQLGAKSGLVVKPATPVETVFPFLNDLDMVLIMTVEPGFGGQSFMADMLQKVKALRHECEKRGLKDFDIQVDGGISEKTIIPAAKAGANVFVAGNAIFGSSNPKETIAKMKENAKKHLQI